ncbi:MAG: hypothetical protein IKZ22_06765, partial [Kiritimatiellae bacterium]|nr:hypothetical protein [Kiritimatiellia bacterium]
ILQWCTVFDERATLGMPYSLNRVHTILTNRAERVLRMRGIDRRLRFVITYLKARLKEDGNEKNDIGNGDDTGGGVRRAG